MRVIGGEFRSRLLKSVPGLNVRPTPDRLREALFNVLAPQIEGTTFADLYAGTGAVGIEALSRGAARAIFIEQDRAALGVLRQNLKSLGVESRADVRHGKASAHLGSIEAGVIFLDPPYDLESEYQTALAKLGEKAPRLVIVQHDVRLKLKESYGDLHQTRVLRHGDNCLTFFSLT